MFFPKVWNTFFFYETLPDVKSFFWLKKLYDYLCNYTICLHHSTLYSWGRIFLPSSCCSPCRPICLMFSFFFSTSFEKVLIFHYLSICIYIYTQSRITIHQSTVRIHIIIYLYTKMHCFPHLERKELKLMLYTGTVSRSHPKFSGMMTTTKFPVTLHTNCLVCLLSRIVLSFDHQTLTILTLGTCEYPNVTSQWLRVFTPVSNILFSCLFRLPSATHIFGCTVFFLNVMFIV